MRAAGVDVNPGIREVDERASRNSAAADDERCSPSGTRGEVRDDASSGGSRTRRSERRAIVRRRHEGTVGRGERRGVRSRHRHRHGHGHGHGHGHRLWRTRHRQRTHVRRRDRGKRVWRGMRARRMVGTRGREVRCGRRRGRPPGRAWCRRGHTLGGGVGQRAALLDVRLPERLGGRRRVLLVLLSEGVVAARRRRGRGEEGGRCGGRRGGLVHGGVLRGRDTRGNKLVCLGFCGLILMFLVFVAEPCLVFL